jgi:hypothetical protein
MTRLAWLFFLGCTGCQMLTLPAPMPGKEDKSPRVQVATVSQSSSSLPGGARKAEREEDGEKAQGSRPRQQATGQAGVADPGDQHLVLAADSLEQGRMAQALVYLEGYVNQRPAQVLVRLQLAELLFREKKLEDARIQFELFVALTQDQGERAFRYLIHTHSRLVEIAEVQEDEYQEHLHRGIGLYLLARRRVQEAGKPGEITAESILCRAAAELQMACAGQRDQARPNLYLYEVYKRLGQDAAAVRALQTADGQALIGPMTPCERRRLQAACLGEFSVPRF